MTATCKLCSAIIQVQRSGVLLNPGSDPEAVEAIVNISEFDLLAARMANHVTERHRDEAMELSAIGFLCSKMYAMVHATSTETEFASLRAAWRTGILDMMQKIGAAQADTASVLPPAEGGSTSTPSGA